MPADRAQDPHGRDFFGGDECEEMIAHEYPSLSDLFSRAKVGSEAILHIKTLVR